MKTALLISLVFIISACQLLFRRDTNLSYENLPDKITCIRSALEKTKGVKVLDEGVWDKKKDSKDGVDSSAPFDRNEWINYAVESADPRFEYSVSLFYYPGQKREILNRVSTHSHSYKFTDLERSAFESVTTSIKKYCGVPVSEKTDGNMKDAAK